MKNDIHLHVIGNTSPFSLMGESSGYMLTVNDCRYLLECGSPVFPSLGFKGIAEIKGIFASHSHEDHKRWFTDVVLFTYYNPLFKHKIRLISSEVIIEEFIKNSKGALERSLSHDSKQIVDIPHEEMIEKTILGPRGKYFIHLRANGDGSFQYEIKDRQDQAIGPEKAKIVINPAANRPRLLYKDYESGEWVEPASYYPFSSPAFYEENQNIYRDDDAGLTVKAIKSSVWHGVPTIAFKFMTEKNNLLFSSDTVYKPPLWKQLHEEYRPQKFDSISREDFEKSSIIYGDINDFIERTWSHARYEAAMSAYKGSVVLHDVARKNSIVHTDYPDIGKAPIDNLIFTHNPDSLTAWRPILKSGKNLVLRNGHPCESVKGKLYPFDADIYIHHFSTDLVGYKSKRGAYKVIEKDDLLGVVTADHPQKGLMRVELFQDVGGEYFPALNDPDKYYSIRHDGKVEEVTFDANSSTGRVVENVRGRIKKRHA
jgi:ribonuclease BN (tRNA processing enzyme)